MGTTIAPRIDERLRRFIEGSPEHAAEVTRRVGALAWELRLTRPSYQQVRVLLNASRGASGPARRPQAPPPKHRLADLPLLAGPGTGVLDLLVGMPRRDVVRTARRAVDVPLSGRRALELIDRLWEYPAPGLAGFYERYKHGRL